jgi:hypothetical protein
MAFWILLAGLGFGLLGAVMVALGDAWLSRSVLIYLDAVEANVGKVVEAIRSEDIRLTVTGIDLKRDRGQNRARVLKTFGWLAVVLSFGVQIVAVCLTRISS